MNKSRILYVIDNERYGGGERAFAQLINGLDKRKYSICAACLPGSAGPASRRFAAEIAGAAELIPYDLRTLVYPFNITRLARVIRQKDVRLVHCQGARANFYARAAVSLAGRDAALVCTVASPLEEYDVGPARKALYLIFDRFLEGRVDKFVAVAAHIERKLLRRGVSPGKVELIRNGVELGRYSADPAAAAAAREKFGVGRDAFLAGVFSRLSPEKGLFSLVEAARKMKDGGTGFPAVRFLVAGEGQLEKALKEKVRGLGLTEEFVFAGFQEDVRPLLGAVDALVLPSLREGFPMGVLEAMAMGRAVVASRIDGVDESVSDGTTGLLFPAGDAGALALALTDLLRDREKCRRLGAAGKAVAEERYDLGKTLLAHERLYDGLLGGGVRATP